MKKFKKGDIVVRKSYNKDIIFYIKQILKVPSGNIATLCGVFERIEADSKLDDLELLDKKVISEVSRDAANKLNSRIEEKYNSYRFNIIDEDSRLREKFITGRILHLDGDKRYSQKSYNYYKKMGLNAIVKNIPEYKQPRVIYNLLRIYKPDILIITGHDGMIKRGTNYNDIYNYRNSRHFINTVKEARKYDKDTNSNTVIFAGACQSYFEAIMMAGANFASSPARILIDFLDPLIIAEKVATTEKCNFISIDEVTKEIRDGKKGIGGIGSNGKMIIV